MKRALVLTGSSALTFAVLTGCAAAGSDGSADTCGGQTVVEVRPVDIWGRSITATVSGPNQGAASVITAGASFHIDAPGLVPTDVTLTPGASGLTTSATGGAALALGRSPTIDDTTGCRVQTLFVGLDHPIFAAGGRAPTDGNKATLLMDGEDYWGKVYEDLVANPTARVHQTTWWWQSDFELWRSATHPTDSVEERQKHTMIALLAGREHVREVVARFAAGRVGGLAYLNTDEALRQHGRDPNDTFEVMLQPNDVKAPLQGAYEAPPLPIDLAARVAANPDYVAWQWPAATHVQSALEDLEAASFHQKGLVIGDSIAFVSGMNVKSTDWDSHDHRVFDARRMIFDATPQQRQAVVERRALPDRGPRKDYGIRVEGPGAQDVDDVLRRRWDYGIAAGAMFAGDATRYDLLPRAAPAGNHMLQIVATMPEPIAERSIFETQAKAVRQAKQLIYIEDQYFRAPMLDAEIQKSMAEHPDLYLVVITKPVTAADGGKKWTVISDQSYRDAFPNRYALLQLQTWDKEAGVHYFESMDTHSKITIVDDDYVCVGSANKNNRGYLYEGELDVAVYDKAFTTEARGHVYENLVGHEHAAELASATTGKQLFDLFVSVSQDNAAFQAAAEADPTVDGAPSGFLYPLTITPDYAVDVGPDVF